jgi:hypothetical protein
MFWRVDISKDSKSRFVWYSVEGFHLIWEGFLMPLDPMEVNDALADYSAASSAASLAELRKQNANVAQCPYCGGPIPAYNVEVCMHCRKPLFWDGHEVGKTKEEAAAKSSRAHEQWARERREQLEVNRKRGAWLASEGGGTFIFGCVVLVITLPAMSLFGWLAEMGGFFGFIFWLLAVVTSIGGLVIGLFCIGAACMDIIKRKPFD